MTAPVDALRPHTTLGVALSALISLSGSEPLGTPDAHVTGVSLNSRQVLPGDLYAALPGAHRHGAQFAHDAVAAGAVAILTDPAGAEIIGEELGGGKIAVPVLVCEHPRDVVGAVAARVYGTENVDGRPAQLLAVTGTNGKTTTSYLLRSLAEAAGRRSGLIGTIEILAGAEPIPSKLTTPEAPHVHSLLALMKDRGVQTMAMEVSSHALAFHRVDGVRFDVAGFTNLTQDHLDLHGTMEEYFEAKAQLFTAAHTNRAVVLCEDDWGLRMAQRAVDNLGAENVISIAPEGLDSELPELAGQPWRVENVAREGLGHRFELAGPNGERLRATTGLPGPFNVANAAVAVLVILAGGMKLEDLQALLDDPEVLTPMVPGRMQVVALRPQAIVDFAHNPDALVRALHAVRPTDGGRVIVVVGATGDRDQTKRPIMGRICAELADVVIVTDDDPHDEDAATIRAAVLAGALEAVGQQLISEVDIATEVIEVAPRGAAIAKAVELADETDSILVAGRGHEVWQEVRGVDLALDDRVELARAIELKRGRA